MLVDLLSETLLPVAPGVVADLLRLHHYLGPTGRGIALCSRLGIAVFAPPTSRRLPPNWLELTRWCLLDRSHNSGSMHWRQVRRWLQEHTTATTLVSYSDPSVGHDGGLYRACNWLWAPTWHRLRPPPSGQGSWVDGKVEAVKDRWVFPLRRDGRRAAALSLADAALRRAMPWAEFREGRGGDWKRWVKHKETV